MAPSPVMMIVLTICLLSHSIRSQDPTYNYHDCGKNDTWIPNTSHSAYQPNLEEKLSTHLLSFSTAADRENGFFISKISLDGLDAASHSSASPLYASFLCRGDVSADTCSSCVAYATKDAVHRCPMSKHVVIWYDECTLRYSDAYNFGSDADYPQVTLLTAMNISSPNQLAGFIGTIISGEMASQAASSTSGKKFVTKEGKLSMFEKLYSMVQCTPDLPAADCLRCIQTGISDLYPGAKGCRVLLPSCMVRYETYPFYNVTWQSSPSASHLPKPVLGPSGTSKGKKKALALSTVRITVPVAVLALLLAATVCILLIRRENKKPLPNDFESAIIELTTSAESLQYDFSVLQAGTDNFSDANKLGQGVLGGVYKGKLSNGGEIAVKRLSQSSGQGVGVISSEIMLVAKLQHRNLVQLLGFCLAGNEKLLVYEFVPNKSLDYFFSDPEKQIQLDWTTRYNIIGGIARGLLYLHEDSGLKIIHRDLKPSNILLDANMMPKISDFGMAKFICPEQAQSYIDKVMGTNGYLAPEAFLGELSVKSDVYSFGVLVLEIISGQKINDFHQPGYDGDLISYAWKKWNEEEPVELMDETLRGGSYSWSEVTRCIHMGLLCVQKDMEARPSMSAVILMLSSESVTVPLPVNPEFYSRTAHCHSKSVNEVSITEVGPR